MANKTYDFDLDLLDMDDVPMKQSGGDTNLTLWKLLSGALGSAQSQQEPLKLLEWAMNLRKDKKLSLDTTDKEKLEQFISNCQSLNVLIQGRLLMVLKTDPEKLKKA